MGRSWDTAAGEDRSDRMGTGVALIAVGALLAFAFTGDLLGIDTDVLGALLLAAGVGTTVLAGSGALRRRRPGSTGRR